MSILSVFYFWNLKCLSAILVLIICGVLGGKQDALAHMPIGSEFKAFHFPDQFLPVIDGELGDWGIFEPSFAIVTEDLVDLVDPDQEEVDLEDFALKAMVGWSETTNRLYLAAQITDDVHQVDRPPGTAASRIFQDDDIEIFIDADHSGGQYADFVELTPEEQVQKNGTEANHFIVAGPPPDEDFLVNFSAAGWYALSDGPFSAAAIGQNSSGLGTAVTTTYEIMLVPFDKVDIGAAFLSDEHDLTVNEILGFNLEFNDFDRLSELFDAKWSLSGGTNGFKFSERFSDLRLTPLDDIFEATVVRSKSWARIKASFDN
ncbi:MAG: hypothetical protein GKR89_21305 [Candidatus Latescibacteria bacterium]|nr:hypothetical protein [Candidatus Latescibacterota bacterium]